MNTQEKLFKGIIAIKNGFALQNIASYVQNDLQYAIGNNNIDVEKIKEMQSDQQKEFDRLIAKLETLKKECFEYFNTVLPETLTGEQIQSKLMAYWFIKSYSFVSEHFHTDNEFIEKHDFYVIVTKDSARNGYDFDKKLVLTTLKLNEKYKIKSMSVSQSSSSVELCDFPGINFNSINFEFSPEYTEKVYEVDSHTTWE